MGTSPKILINIIKYSLTVNGEEKIQVEKIKAAAKFSNNFAKRYIPKGSKILEITQKPIS